MQSPDQGDHTRRTHHSIEPLALTDGAGKGHESDVLCLPEPHRFTISCSRVPENHLCWSILDSCEHQRSYRLFASRANSRICLHARDLPTLVLDCGAILLQLILPAHRPSAILSVIRPEEMTARGRCVTQGDGGQLHLQLASFGSAPSIFISDGPDGALANAR